MGHQRKIDKNSRDTFIIHFSINQNEMDENYEGQRHSIISPITSKNSLNFKRRRYGMQRFIISSPRAHLPSCFSQLLNLWWKKCRSLMKFVFGFSSIETHCVALYELQNVIFIVSQHLCFESIIYVLLIGYWMIVKILEWKYAGNSFELCIN